MMTHKTSPFSPETFANPPRKFRPLQITHGLDRYGGESSAVGQGEVDPAGEWAERLDAQQDADTALDLSGIDAYLRHLDDLGVGGIVTNVGFEDYLVSPKQWEILRHGLRAAADLGLRVWLYDEKGYPSGTAGGVVTRANPELTALGLACYITEVDGPQDVVIPMPVSCRAIVGASAMRTSETAPAVAEAEPLDRPDASLVDLLPRVDLRWRVLRWTAPEGTWRVLIFAERVMYEGTHAQGNVCEFKHYVNLLDPAATRAFIRVTHEAYRREIPDDVWSAIEAIFTDEPSFMTYYVPALPERYWGKVPVVDAPIFADRPPAVPWRPNFLGTFRDLKGYDLKPHLHALFFSANGQPSAIGGPKSAHYIRQDYYDVITRLYADAFYGQVLAWCRAHGIASSGHVLLEESLCDHVAFHGSLFAAVRKMDLPGIDMLNCDPVEMLHGGSFMGASFMAVKQVASVAHLTGAKRIHSESSDWEQRNKGGFASLSERRGQANLQYVLGVNQITSYFGWTELGDEAQQQYHDYVGRLGTLLTGGRHVCDVAVLYPIRTLWAHYMPPLKPIPNWADRQHRSEWIERVSAAYNDIVKRLLCAQVDVDIVDEEAIITGDRVDGALHVADEAYRVIVLPPLDALALDTARALADFCAAGGTLLSVGPLPTLAESAENTPVMREIIAALFGDDGPARVVELDQLPDHIARDLTLALPNPNVLYTHRVLEGRHVYFIINNTPELVTLRPTLRELGPYTLYKPLTGEVVSADERLQLTLEGFEGIFVVESC